MDFDWLHGQISTKEVPILALYQGYAGTTGWSNLGEITADVERLEGDIRNHLCDVFFLSSDAH